MSRESAREKILGTAATLFYMNGFRAIGVDTIVEQSGVAKMSLYRHFPSKDDLIAAHLQNSHNYMVGWANDLIAPYPDDARAALIALFEGVAEEAGKSTCFGCNFLLAASEFPDLEHPAHKMALSYKQTLRDLLLGLTRQAGAADPEELADQLYLLIDGAWAAVRVFGPVNPSRNIVGAVQVLLDASQVKA